MKMPKCYPVVFTISPIIALGVGGVARVLLSISTPFSQYLRKYPAPQECSHPWKETPSQTFHLISIFWPHARTQVSKGCRPHELQKIKCQHCSQCDIFWMMRFVLRRPIFSNGRFRTWALDVTDDASGGVVHELDSDLRNTSTGTCESQILLQIEDTIRLVSIRSRESIPVRPKTRVTFTSLTGTFEESMFAIYNYQSLSRRVLIPVLT